MNVPRLACILLPLVAVSCQPPANSGAATSPSNSKAESKDGTITVTVDGREATPEEKEAFGALAKKLLSDAVHTAINEACQEFLKKLEITDPTEAELFSVSFGPETSGGEELLSVCVIRPGNEIKEP